MRSGTYYLRARYYSPETGRFLTEDTHWNTGNNIYGDNPVKIDEQKDPLGLNVYTYMPDINAIRQSQNLYVYCINNPIMYQDSSGNSITLAVIGFSILAVGAIGTYAIWLNWVNSPEGQIAINDASDAIVDAITSPTIQIDINNVVGVPGVTLSSNVNDLAKNQKDHILNSKHNWNKLVPDPEDPNNWEKIATIITSVLANGTEERYKQVYQKSLEIGGELVTVVYNIVDGAVRIGNAWVK